MPESPSNRPVGPDAAGRPARRTLLLGGAALLPATLLARAAGAAERRPARAGAAHGKGGKTADATPAGTPATTPIGPIDTVARWALIIDFTTGATLLEKDADVAMPPSSMTKIMTAYIVYGMLKSGRLKLDQTLAVSEKAWRMGGSKMFVPLGGQVGVEDLIRGMIVDSGNDACIVLAEGIAGSEDQFVELMNAKAKELGLAQTHFVDCTGWPADGHVMSCRDIATLAHHLITDFPEYYHYDAERSFKYNGIDQQNRNPLVQRGMADGLKTGHTEAGGYGLVASAQRGDRRVVMVLNGMETDHQRREESERLLDWGFREFENVKLFASNEPVEQARVWLGDARTVPLIGQRPVVITMPHGWQQSAKITVDYQQPIPAPVARGAVVGKLSVTGPGVPATEVPLVAGADVGRLGLPGRSLAVLAHYMTGG